MFPTVRRTLKYIVYIPIAVIAVASERSSRRQNEVNDTSEVKTDLTIRILVKKTFRNNFDTMNIDNLIN